VRFTEMVPGGTPMLSTFPSDKDLWTQSKDGKLLGCYFVNK